MMMVDHQVLRYLRRTTWDYNTLEAYRSLNNACVLLVRTKYVILAA